MSATVPKIRVVGDPVLSATCRPVTAFDESLNNLVGDMFASMYVAAGVGLAAPQIGVDLAVFVYDCPDGSGKQHKGEIVNPTVVSTGGQSDASDEGCLSVPGPYHELARPTIATVQGYDRTGAPVEVTGTGFFARCLLHEADHLRGLLYIDHLPRNQRRRVLRDMEPQSWNDLTDLRG